MLTISLLVLKLISFSFPLLVPAFSKNGQLTFQIVQNSMMSLACDAVGYPNTFTYQWKKDGELIAGANESFLIVYQAMLHDVGYYECIPSNGEGEFSSHNTTKFTINIRS